MLEEKSIALLQYIPTTSPDLFAVKGCEWKRARRAHAEERLCIL